jgi:hypothetical protein
VVAEPAEEVVQITILSGVGRVTLIAAAGVLAEGGERAEQKHSNDDKGLVHPVSPLLIKLSGILVHRVIGIVVALLLIAGA